MTVRLMCAGIAIVLVAASGVDRPVAAQDLPNNAPGRPTPVRTTIINTQNEPVPVRFLGSAEIPVVGGSTPVPVRIVRPLWDYRSVSVSARNSADIAAALNAAGGEGWEAVGMTPVDGSIVVLMKRAR